MAEPKVGLRPSKKFANGSIHEVGTGMFEVLDRYLENNVIMLKYKWLTGDLEGEFETNKEVNVNANIWKFKRVRGIPTDNKGKKKGETVYDDEDGISNDDIMSQLEHMEEIFKDLRKDELRREDLIDEFHQTTDNMVAILKEYEKQRERKIEELDTLQKQVHEIRETLLRNTNTIDRLFEMVKVNQDQIATLIKQNDLASKLIDKM